MVIPVCEKGWLLPMNDTLDATFCLGYQVVGFDNLANFKKAG